MVRGGRASRRKVLLLAATGRESPSLREMALILAVDDEPGILKLVNQILSEEGFRVVTARDGEEAVAAAEQYRPDIVLLDLTLPDMDGLEVMRRVDSGGDLGFADRYRNAETMP